MSDSSFHSKETLFKGNYQQRLFKTLGWAYAPFRKQILLVFAFGFLGRLIVLLNTNLMGQWVDSYCRGDHCSPRPPFLLSWTSTEYLQTSLALCFVGFILVWNFRVAFSRLSAKAISRLYDEVTYRTSRYPISFFEAHPVGRIITRFGSDYGNLFRFFGGPLAEFIALVFDLIVMVILVGLASPYFLILVFLNGLFNALIYRRNKTRLREERRTLSMQRSPSIAHFAETAHGVSSIRTYLRQKEFASRFQRLNNLFLDQKLKTFKTLSFFSFRINSLTALLLLLTGLFSLFLLKYNLVSVGSIGVAFTFITLSSNTLQSFFEWLAQIDEALVGGERLDHYLYLPMESGLRLPTEAQFPTGHWTQSHPKAPSPFLPRNESERGRITFSKVFFRYRENFPWILKDITFEIQSGERVGIIGQTGSGKSTLIQALCYLYPLTAGEITINGKKPYLQEAEAPKEDEISLEDYRQWINLIPQDPVLFRGSLRENLTIHEKTTDQELHQALERVGLNPWMKTLPSGLDSPIEERGKNLSAGERQLLCMARCLVQKSPIVVMDEATSSVDPESERIMVEATENFFVGRTQLIIAHRLSTLQKCDRILWLHKGEIYRIGKPEEILSEFLQKHGNEVIV